jgi:hypothetical protein
MGIPTGIQSKKAGTRASAMLCSVAACVGLMATSLPASAEPLLTERLRLQGGYITDKPPRPASRLEDYWAGAVPGLNLTWLTPEAALSIDYQILGAVHSNGALSEVANFLTLGAVFTPSLRSSLFVAATGTQSTNSSFLISRPAGGSTVSLYPAIGSRLVTGGLSQGYSYELTQRLRFEQSADAAIFTTLPPTPALDTFNAGLGLGLEYVWRNDGLGADVRGGYTTVQALPPILDQQFVTGTLAPRWRHDWSRSVNSLVTGGATVIASPDRDTKPRVAPFGRASILYTDGRTTVDLSYSTGVFPSLLSGQLLNSHAVTLHGVTPLSQHHQVFLGSSIGYVHSKFIDLRGLGNEQEFDSVLTDVDLTWQIKPLVQLFARYQFIAQVGDITALGINPSFLRDIFLVGVQFSTRPASTPTSVQTGFPQRVDQSDVVRPNQRQPTNGEQTVPPRTQQQQQQPTEDSSSWTTTPPNQDPRGPTRWIYTTPAQPAQPKHDDDD